MPKGGRAKQRSRAKWSAQKVKYDWAVMFSENESDLLVFS